MPKSMQKNYLYYILLENKGYVLYKYISPVNLYALKIITCLQLHLRAS